MKKILIYSLPLIFLSLSFSSCVTLGELAGVTLVTHNSQAIHDVYVSHIDHDTIHYVVADSFKASRKILFKDSVAYQSIYGGDIASGVNYFKPDSASKMTEFIHSLDYDTYYQKFDTLPSDTVLNINNSILSVRTTVLPYALRSRRINHFLAYEYVLSMPSGEHYLIPDNQLGTFIKNTNEDIYRMYLRTMRMNKATVGLGVLFPILGVGGCCLMAVGEKNDTPALLYAGIGTMGLGVLSAITAVCINVKTINIVDYYNEKVSTSTPTLSLNAHLTSNGIGVSLDF